MANNNSTLRNDINTSLEAIDTLDHAHSMTEFLQDILTLNGNGSLPESMSTTGLYHIMQDIKDRIKGATMTLDQARKSDDIQAYKSDLYNLVDEKFSILLYALVGLRDEAKHSEITSNDIGKFESLVSSSRFEITSMLKS